MKLLPAERLVSGTSLGNIYIWSLENFQMIKALKTPDSFQKKISSLTCLEYSHGEIISSFSDGRIQVWNLNDSLCDKTINSHTGMINYIKYSNGKLFSCGNDKQIKIWDLKTGKLIQTLKGHKDAVTMFQLTNII